MRYFITPQYDLAINLKVATSSLARAVIAAHYPELENLITKPHGDGNGTAYPEGKGPDTTRWQGIIPSRNTPEQTVVLIVRDPVERFRSACAESGVKDLDVKLIELETDANRNLHFNKQSDVIGEIKLFKFEEHLEVAATLLGLAWPLPHIPSLDKAPKPDLTREQISRIEAIYADDITLHTSIAEAGQDYEIRPTAEPVAVPQQLELWQFRAALKATPHGEGTLFDAVMSTKGVIESQNPRKAAALQEYIDHGSVIYRDSKVVTEFIVLLALTNDDADALFIEAGKLEA